MLKLTTQVPCTQGMEAHSSTSISQLVPLYPGRHTQKQSSIRSCNRQKLIVIAVGQCKTELQYTTTVCLSRLEQWQFHCDELILSSICSTFSSNETSIQNFKLLKRLIIDDRAIMSCCLLHGQIFAQWFIITIAPHCMVTQKTHSYFMDHTIKHCKVDIINYSVHVTLCDTIAFTLCSNFEHYYIIISPFLSSFSMSDIYEYNRIRYYSHLFVHTYLVKSLSCVYCRLVSRVSTHSRVSALCAENRQLWQNTHGCLSKDTTVQCLILQLKTSGTILLENLLNQLVCAQLSILQVLQV